MPGSLIAALGERYGSERELGQGGMATVYLARDLRHDRDVAVKVLRAELEARAVTSRVSFYTRAVSAIYLGRIDEALEHALRSAELKDAIGLVWYRWPDLEPLQTHPRYPEVLARLRA